VEKLSPIFLNVSYNLYLFYTFLAGVNNCVIDKQGSRAL